MMEGLYGCMGCMGAGVVWVHGCMGAWVSALAAVVHVTGCEGDYSPSAMVEVFTRLPLESIDSSSTQ